MPPRARSRISTCSRSAAASRIPALADDRYRSRVNATFDVKGSGGGRYPLTLDATGTAVDSEMFGASFPRLDFTTQHRRRRPARAGDRAVRRPRSGGRHRQREVAGNLTGARRRRHHDSRLRRRRHRRFHRRHRPRRPRPTRRLRELAIDTARRSTAATRNREGQLKQVVDRRPRSQVDGPGRHRAQRHRRLEPDAACRKPVARADRRDHRPAAQGRARSSTRR